MTIREIYAFYGLKPAQYRYLEEIAENPGISNDQLSRHLQISPQMAGRVASQLETAGVIYNELDGLPHPRKAWYVKQDEEPLASIRLLLGMGDGGRF